MKYAYSTLLLGLAFTCASCNMLRDKYSSKPHLFHINSGLAGGDQADFFRPDGTVNVHGESFKALYEAAKQASGGKQARNEIVGLSMLASDRIAHQTISGILANQATANMSLGTATTLFSGLATLVGGETTRSALSGAATFTNAERSLLNEEIYQNALATAVVKQIEQGRSSIRALIKRGMDEEIDTYSIHEALADLEAYHNTASFAYGLTKIVDKSFRTPTLSEQLLSLKNMKSQMSGNKLVEDAIDVRMKALIEEAATEVE